MFVISLVITVAIVGSLLIVLAQHARRHHKIESSEAERGHSATGLSPDSKTATDLNKAA